MSKIKLVLVGVLLILILVAVMANWENVEVNLLVARVPMPKALLLLVTFLVGVGTGALTPWRWALKSERKKKA